MTKNDFFFNSLHVLNRKINKYFSFRSEVEDLRRNESQREAGELIADKTLRQIEEMKSEKLELTNTITQLEIEHKKLTKELQRVEKERENILTRKESVTGENMQLIMEAEEFHQVKADLTNQVSYYYYGSQQKQRIFFCIS